jgi:hypothetical protein
LIDTLISSVKSGGGWFSVISNVVSIGAVLFTVVLDYYVIQHNIPVFNETYSDALSIYERVTKAQTSYEQCGYIPIPATIEMLDKLLPMVDTNAGKNDYTKIYKIIVCVSNGHLDNYLKEKPEFLKTDVAEFSDKASKALVPYGASAVNYEPYSKELVVLESYLGIVDNMLGSMIVYTGDSDNPVINIEQTSTNLNHYATMPPQDLAIMLKTQAAENQKTQAAENQKTQAAENQKTQLESGPFSLKNSFSSFFSATGKDILDLWILLIDKVLETGPVPAVSIIDAYIFTIQDFCKNKFRELQDFQTKSERNLNDFLTKVYRTLHNAREFIKMLKILLWINGFAGGIIINYCHTLFVKIKTLRRERERERGRGRSQSQLEIEPGNNFEEIEGSEQRLLLEAPTIQPRSRPRGQGRGSTPGMNTENILSSTNTGVRTRMGSTIDTLMQLKNAPVETINAIDGGNKRKRKTIRHKKHRTKKLKRGKKHKRKTLRHKKAKARPTRRR